MAAPRQILAPAWSVRLAFELTANDLTAKAVVADLTEEQLNWRPAPGSWSVGQCLEHLCIMNETYMPPISAALEEKPDSPVEQIIPGRFARWFIRSFTEPSPNTKRVLLRPRSGPARMSAFLFSIVSCPSTELAANSSSGHAPRT